MTLRSSHPASEPAPSRGASRPVEGADSEAGKALVALAEVRGWVMLMGPVEREFMLPRIDRAITAFGVPGYA